MEYVNLAQQFKSKHVKEGMRFPLSYMFDLFLMLKQNGIKIDQVTEKFYKDLTNVLFADESQEVHFYAMQTMMYCAQMMYYDTTEEKVKETESIKQQAPQSAPRQKSQYDNMLDEDGLIYDTEQLVKDMPSEDEEGDGMTIAPEDVIHLRPEDVPKKKIDWNFAERLGLKRPDNE